jgi:hypothetical protein
MKCSVQYAFACILVLAGGTHSSIESGTQGTVVFVEVLKDEIVFVADSRVTAKSRDGGGGAFHMDNDCKLTAFENDAIFASSGARHYTFVDEGKPNTWDSHEVAQEAIRLGRIPQGEDTVVAFAAKYWAARAKSFFQIAYDIKPSDFPHNIDIVNGAFASRDKTGQFSAYTVRITPEDGPANSKKQVIVSVTKPLVKWAIFSYPPVIQEFMALESTRSREEATKWGKGLPRNITEEEFGERLAIQLVQWTIDFTDNPMIGGDVNAVVLDRKGIRWPVQKEYCRNAK